LLGWLTFAEIGDRQEQVKDAHNGTFGWIFTSGNKTGFAEWLRTGTGIYWIRGKPASGKSTLMKFIARESRLGELLQDWAENYALVFGSFYFWMAGTPLQRSLIGLYRTMLTQMLKTDDSLCRIAFPDWQRRYSETEPTMEMLKAAMNNLLACTTMFTKFFFAIDGLDEYERDSIGKTELAELMLNLTRSYKVKLLLSSRPESPFEVAFRTCPSLRLESLTKRHIWIYTKNRLFSNMTKGRWTYDEQVAIADIGNFIVRNAAGVFLWVALVLNVALDGFHSYEDLSTIRARIRSLPRELDDLFTHILTKRISPDHKAEAYRYLLIALEWEKHPNRMSLSPVILAIAWQASDYQKACSLAMLPPHKTEEAVKDFPSRLKNRCQGLLEVPVERGVSLQSVQFFHRTLFDYLNERADAKDDLARGAGDSFQVHVAIMASFACVERSEAMSKRYLVSPHGRGSQSSAHFERTQSMSWRRSVSPSGRELLTAKPPRMSQRKDRGSWLEGRRPKYIETFFLFNASAEAATQRHNTELVSIFDRIMRDRFKAVEGVLANGPAAPPMSLAGNWFGEDFSHEYTEKIDVDFFGYVIRMGGALHLRQAIRDSKVECPAHLTQLLYHALHLSESCIRPVSVSSNVDAVMVLLEHGVNCNESATRDLKTPSQVLLRRLHHILSPATVDGNIDNVPEILTLLSLFRKHALDRHNAPFILVPNGSEGTLGFIPVSTPELVQGLVLGWHCCSGRQIRECFCARAQEWSGLATALLEQCKVMSELTAPRKRMCSWKWQDFSLPESSISTHMSEEVRPTWVDERGHPRYNGKKACGGTVPRKCHRLSNVTVATEDE
jgi:hypothetical protein